MTLAPERRARPARAIVAFGPRRRRPAADRQSVSRQIYTSGRVYVACTAGLALAWLLMVEVDGVARAVDDIDHSIVRWIVDQRDAQVAQALVGPVSLASEWAWRVLRWVTVVVLVLSRRFRHLAVYALLVLGASAVTTLVSEAVPRVPPGSALALRRPDLFTHPSRATVALGLSAVAAMYTLIPRGRPRNTAKVAVVCLMAAFAAGRLYLTVEHPTDVVVALILGMAVPVVAFRYLTPDDSFPIRYGRVDEDAEIEAASARVAAAAEEQLGWHVQSVEMLSPPGSSGSMPMRLVVVDPDSADSARTTETVVFGKLYSRAHLRSDRWYKVWRAIRYGRLEDEAPFGDLRHLVEREDYMLRVAADADLPVPMTYGILDVTRGREYALLMEWLPGAQQLSPEAVTDEAIDDGFAIVAQMWRSGMAHRDIKPANLAVTQGRLYLVDLSFAEVRPSPWREAVDLGTMTLCLALCAGPERVVGTATEHFTPDEVAEALAAAHSVTIPAQLRALLRESDSDVLAECRALVPAHPPIAIQRWSVARVALTGALVAAAFLTVTLLAYNFDTAGLL